MRSSAHVQAWQSGHLLFRAYFKAVEEQTYSLGMGTERSLKDTTPDRRGALDIVVGKTLEFREIVLDTRQGQRQKIAFRKGESAQKCCWKSQQTLEF